MAYNSGLTSVTGNVTSISTEYTVLFSSSTQDSSGDVTIGTVPASKIWRIVGLNLGSSSDETSSTGDYVASIKLNNVAAISCCFRVTTATDRQQASTSTITFAPNCCPILTAGQAILLNQNSSSMYSRGSVFYVEESV